MTISEQCAIAQRDFPNTYDEAYDDIVRQRGGYQGLKINVKVYREIMEVVFYIWTAN